MIPKGLPNSDELLIACLDGEMVFFWSLECCIFTHINTMVGFLGGLWQEAVIILSLFVTQPRWWEWVTELKQNFFFIRAAVYPEPEIACVECSRGISQATTGY